LTGSRAQRVRYLRDRDQLGARVEQLAVFVEQDLAAVVDRITRSLAPKQG
jgi:hypothetical protein